jgi:hypothetical protein
MDNEQDADLFFLTAQYVGEVQAGLSPSVRDYIARYPRYADAIADFVAYYHLFEAPLSEDVTPDNSFSSVAQSAWYAVQQRILTNPYPSTSFLSADTVKENAPVPPRSVAIPLARVAEQESSYQATSFDCTQAIEEAGGAV